MGTEDQRNRGYRGLEEQWTQRTRGTEGTEDQRNSGYRGPEEQWAQRIRRTVDIDVLFLAFPNSERFYFVS